MSDVTKSIIMPPDPPELKEVKQLERFMKHKEVEPDVIKTHKPFPYPKTDKARKKADMDFRKMGSAKRLQKSAMKKSFVKGLKKVGPKLLKAGGILAAPLEILFMEGLSPHDDTEMIKQHNLKMKKKEHFKQMVDKAVK